MTRAVAYTRVSTDRQNDSLELQAAKVAAYCAMRELELVEVVEDETVSPRSLFPVISYPIRSAGTVATTTAAGP